MVRQKKISPLTRLKKPLLWGTILLILVAGGFGVYLYINRDQSSKIQTPVDSIPSAGRTETSEGSSFTVPDSVPEGAIKNYTLVTENEQYKIRHDEQSNSYIITLYAIINNPDQYSMYRDQLREFKQNALDYLKTEKKTDVSKANITYEPAEATDL